MNKVNRKNRGQFTIIAAILIAIITLSIVLSIHQINLNRQQLNYQPAQELVLGITSDLDRAITHALSIVTKQYNETWFLDPGETLPENVKEKGNAFISNWTRSVLYSYANLGIRISITAPENGGLQYCEFKVFWSETKGYSFAYARFDLDIDAYGLKGWIGHSRKWVTLEIYPDSLKSDGDATTLEFQVKQGKGEDLPIPSLMKDLIFIWATSSDLASAQAHTVTSLTYLGGGNYTATVTPRIDKPLVYMTVITPDDNIYVSTYIERELIVNLSSIEEGSPPSTENLGRIQLKDTLFTLYPNGNSTQISNGTYLLKYYPEDRYEFLRWETSPGITVEDPNNKITAVSICSDGNIKAVYRPVSIAANITLDSRDIGDLENMGESLGSISLDLNSYAPLPVTAINMPLESYELQYTPHNESYFFRWWEAEGNVYPAAYNANPTTLIVHGNGIIIAVYSIEPPQPPTNVTVTLQSSGQRGGVEPNLGKIQLGEEVSESLPMSVTLPSGKYYLSYTLKPGYAFVGWTATEGILIDNPKAQITSVNITRDGTITAIYRDFEISLDSRYIGGPPHHLGNITLGQVTYDELPNTTYLIEGDYPLKYTPENSSYIFSHWEYSGVVIPNDSQAEITGLEVFGDGSIVAVYKPSAGGWKTLFVDKDKFPVLAQQIGDKSSHIPSWASTGEDKQIVVLNSTQCPRIYLSNIVIITAYLGIDPQWNAKDVTMEFGFYYDGKYYLIGKDTCPISSDGLYEVQIDSTKGNYPPSYDVGVVPEGSVLSLQITVTFYESPWGTFKLYFGPKSPSCIEL